MANEIGTYTVPVILSFRDSAKAADKELSGVFGNVGKKASKDLGKGLAAGQADAKKAADAYAKLYDRAADAAGKLRTAEAQLNQVRSSGNTARIVAAEERHAKALRDSERAARDAKDAHNDLSRAQRGLDGSRLDDMGSSGSRLSGVFSSLKANAGAFAGIAAGALVTGLTAAGVAAIRVTKELYDLGAQFDDMSDNLRVKTGASGEALAGLQKSVESIARTTPSSIGTIGDVVAEASRNLHLTGGDLEAVSTQLANLNRITGEQTNMRDLGKAFRAFGVDAEDQQAALDQLYTATTKTGLGVNDLLASVVKGGPALRELGLTFGQSAALLTEFEDAGLDGDNMLTGLRKSLAAFAKEGKDAPTALHDTVAEMQRLIAAGDEAGAQNLANKLFGAKGGLNFFEAIKNGTIDLAALAGGLDTTGQSINEIADATNDGAEAWQTFKNNMAIALEPFATKIFDIANSGLDDLTNWATEHQSDLIEVFTGLTQAATTFGYVTLQVVGGLMEGFGQIGAGIGDTVGLILKGAAAFEDLIGNEEKAASFRKDAETMFGLGEGLTEQGRKLLDFSENLSELGDQFGEAGRQAAAAAKLTDALGGSVDSLKASGQDVTIDIKDNTTEVEAGLKTLGAHLETIAGDPTHLRIVPDTPEAQTAIDAFRAQQTKTPILLPVKLDIDAALRGPLSWHVTVSPGASGPGALGPSQQIPGGIPLPGQYNFASGKMPRQAIIQPPVSGGLVQWAEPSTMGEAFIPLSGTNRKRSQAIWMETGKRLGMMGSFAQGGILNRDYLDQIAQQYFGLTLGSGDRNEPGSYHGTTGQARDYNGPQDKLIQFAQWVSQNLGPYLDELIFDVPGWVGNIKDGRNVGAFGNVYTMGQAGYHGDHVHVAFGKHAAMYAGAPGIGTASMSPQDQAISAIIAEGKRRGYSDQDLAWIVATARGESGLNADITNSIGRHGLFQQDEGYPGRNTLAGQVSGFFNRLDQTQGSNIGSRIAGVQKGGYGPDWIRQFLPRAQADISRVSPMMSAATSTVAGGTGYEVDQNAVREAQQKVTQADQRVMAAQADVAEAEAAQRELEADAKESQKIAALARVDKAKAELANAQQDAADARADVATAQRGKPVAKGEAADKDTGQQTSPVLGELGAIGASFLKETLGIGSWLPDLLQTPNVQSGLKLADYAISQAMGAGQALASGEWMPNPAGGLPLLVPGASTSGAPFGIPDVAAPPMTAGPEHGISAGAAPGPTIIQNVDQSQNFNNSPLGWNPAEVERQRKQAQRRAIPRIPVG